MTTTHDAQRAMKIFFKEELNELDRKEWFAITGQYDLTTKVLWDTIRASESVAGFSGLGAAVSASPQPRCPKCQSEDLQHLTHIPTVAQHVKCKSCLAAFDTTHLHSFAQFFAAAPAQEPRIGEPCPTCERTYLGKMGPGDYSCCVCGMGMVEPCEHWKSFDENAAQEQPVENSPACPKCELPTKPMYGDEPPSEWDHHCAEPSPQKGKP